MELTHIIQVGLWEFSSQRKGGNQW
jgi:hypothetical protein